MKKPKANQNGSMNPTVVLFGLDENRKPRAGRFQGPDVKAALKAAATMGLTVLEVRDEPALQLASKISAGRVAAAGRGFVPQVRRELFEQLERLVAGSNGPNGKPAVGAGTKQAQPPLPANWDDIKVGHLVVAQEKDPEDGWWQAIVTGIDADMLSLRWQRSSRGKQFARHRFNVALIYSGSSPVRVKEGSSKSAQPNLAYPESWDEIDLDKIVLAKEDGPVEQWWEAKPVEKNGDIFTLRWCGHEDLSPIARHRHSLALIYPSPK